MAAQCTSNLRRGCTDTCICPGPCDEDDFMKVWQVETAWVGTFPPPPPIPPFMKVPTPEASSTVPEGDELLCNLCWWATPIPRKSQVEPNLELHYWIAILVVAVTASSLVTALLIKFCKRRRNERNSRQNMSNKKSSTGQTNRVLENDSVGERTPAQNLYTSRREPGRPLPYPNSDDRNSAASVCYSELSAYETIDLNTFTSTRGARTLEPHALSDSEYDLH